MQVLRQQTALESSELNVDVEASILAEIDEDAYREAVLCDADRILHQYLLPMAFPWSEDHSYSDVIKSFPRDIDEMPDILGIEDSSFVPFENGPFGYGKFEVGRSMKSLLSAENQQGKKAATRRTEDAGVIELTIIDAHEIMESSPSEFATPIHIALKTAAGKRNALIESSPRRSMRKRKSSSIDCVETRETKTHILSEYFDNCQATKKAKTDYALSRVQKMFVSVRFGGVSSRSSILDEDIHPSTSFPSTKSLPDADTSHKTAPLLVKVQLPLEVQGGRFVVLPIAEENAKRLGSYDVRYGLPPTIDVTQKQGNRTKRVACGRTRLTWTRAHCGGSISGESSSSRNRLAYSTILTSERVDISLFKRPRDVTLAVRVNGVRLTDKRIDSTASKAVVDRPFGDDDETVAAASGLSAKTINDAIVAACGPIPTRTSKKLLPVATQPERSGESEPVRGEPICFLWMDKLVDGLLRARKAETVSMKRSAKSNNADACVDAEIATQPVSTLIRPQIECLPTVDGLIGVICTRAGNLQPKWVPAMLEQDPYLTKSPTCSVCFVADAAESIETCSSCGIRVHLSCCLAKGTRLPHGMQWACSMCSGAQGDSVASNQSSNPRKRKSKTPFRFRDAEQRDAPASNPTKQNASSLQCQLCPHSGGAMSPTTRGKGYVHEICRIWTGVGTHPQCEKKDEKMKMPLLHTLLRTLCALCGRLVTESTSKELVRCVASGCLVKFHPMCALLASKMAASETRQVDASSDVLERMNGVDSQLCKEYTLTMMKCQVGESENRITKVLPVAFCGFHNPTRDTSLFGCYPCGGILGESMRIPSLQMHRGMHKIR